jgi:hypothetical protein
VARLDGLPPHIGDLGIKIEVASPQVDHLGEPRTPVQRMEPDAGNVRRVAHVMQHHCRHQQAGILVREPHCGDPARFPTPIGCAHRRGT